MLLYGIGILCICILYFKKIVLIREKRVEMLGIFEKKVIMVCLYFKYMVMGMIKIVWE